MWWFTAWGVWRAGGRPIRVRPRQPRHNMAFDGLIVGGGADVDPALYAEVTAAASSGGNAGDDHQAKSSALESQNIPSSDADNNGATIHTLDCVARAEADDDGEHGADHSDRTAQRGRTATAHKDRKHASEAQPNGEQPPTHSKRHADRRLLRRLAAFGRRLLAWIVYPLIFGLRLLARIGAPTRWWQNLIRRLPASRLATALRSRGPSLGTSGLDPARDTLERALLDRARNEQRPVLGICRGMQLINVHRGGSLHRELSTFYVEQPNARSVLPVKTIVIAPGSRLANTVERSTLAVNALHAQAVDRIADGLRVVGRERVTNVIQAIETPDGPLVIGVQWHPEFLPHLKRHRALFEALVAHAKESSQRSSAAVTSRNLDRRRSQDSAR